MFHQCYQAGVQDVALNPCGHTVAGQKIQHLRKIYGPHQFVDEVPATHFDLFGKRGAGARICLLG